MVSKLSQQHSNRRSKTNFSLVKLTKVKNPGTLYILKLLPRSQNPKTSLSK